MVQSHINILIICICVWMAISLYLYYFINRSCIRHRYKKFYMHPVISLIKHLKNADCIKKTDRIILTILFIFLYLPITPIWFILWCVYKFWNLLNFDDAADGVDVNPEIKNFINKESANSNETENN